MTRKITVIFFKIVVLVFGFSLVLFADGLRRSPQNYVGFIIREVFAVLQDSETQWAIFMPGN
jgi:hypothetical protein